VSKRREASRETTRKLGEKKMNIIKKDSARFADKAFNDFDGDPEQYRFVEAYSYTGNHKLECYIEGVGSFCAAFTVQFEGNGGHLDESHTDYSASIKFNSTRYQQADGGKLAAAISEARLIIEVHMSDNCAALHAKDAAHAAERKLERDIAKAERQARLDSTMPVGLDRAEEDVAECVKEVKSKNHTFKLTTKDRFTGSVDKSSIEFINGKVKCFWGFDAISRKLLVEKIAESDLDGFVIEKMELAA
jgi:hypothetical protein